MITKLSYKWSRQKIIKELELVNVYQSDPDFWDRFWRVLARLGIPPEEQVDIAAKVADDPNIVNRDKLEKEQGRCIPIDGLIEETAQTDTAQCYTSCCNMEEKALDAGVDERDATIWALYHTKYNQSELAQAFHLSQQRISRIISAVNTAVREHWNRSEEWWKVYLLETKRTIYRKPQHGESVPQDLAAAREVLEENGYLTRYYVEANGAIRKTKLIVTDPDGVPYTINPKNVILLSRCVTLANERPDIGAQVECEKNDNNYVKVIVQIGGKTLTGGEFIRNYGCKN